MKTRIPIFSAVACGMAMGTAANCGESLRVVERGPNHSLVEGVTDVKLQDGTYARCTNRWTQLEDGLNYWSVDGKAWEPALEEIELTARGAVALHGQHRVIFSPNVNDPEGAIDVEINHQVRLRSSVLAVGYFDPLEGKAVFIATVKDAGGEWLPPNQVIYRDAFDGLHADLLYTYRKSGLEADIVLREVPPPPTDFGFRAETARLQIYTEFFDPPEPTRRTRILASVQDPATRAMFAEPDWIDEELDFGVCRIGLGRAFAWSAREAAEVTPDQFPSVGKRWVRVPDGRTVLLETVQYAALLDELVALNRPGNRVDDLPRQQFAKNGIGPQLYQRQRGSPTRDSTHKDFVSGALPQRTPAQTPSKLTLVAGSPSQNQGRGLVIDWESVSVGETNYTFRGDETYFVTGSCWLSGTTTLEGGTAIKFQRHTNVWSGVTITGPLACQTSLYRPAVFTAEDDNTIGASIVGGIPNTNVYYGSFAIRFYDVGVPVIIENVRMKHQYRGVYFQGNNPKNIVRNLQVVDSVEGFHTSAQTVVRIENALFDSMRSGGFVFYGETNACFIGEHVTVQRGWGLRNGWAGVTLTNSLLVGIWNVQSYTGAGNFQTATTFGVFASAGAGNSYLPPSSPHRNAGVDAISPVLKHTLAQLTTYPPLMLSETIATDTTLAPQAGRDIDTPDRGYHYPAIDYLISDLAVTNATVIFTNGVAVGIYGSHGLLFHDKTIFRSEGSSAQPNRLLRYNTVQEGGATNWYSVYNFSMLHLDAESESTTNTISVGLRFTDIDALAVSARGAKNDRAFISSWQDSALDLQMHNCELRGLWVALGPMGGGVTGCYINNLFDLCKVTLTSGSYDPGWMNLTMRNNLFLGYKTDITDDQGNGWEIADNMFAPEVLSISGTGPVSNNGFAAGLTPVGANAKTNLVLDFVKGPLGAHYLPSSGGSTSLATLINAGSRSAADAGLYHYTTQVSQTKETNSVVDIGYHYAAFGPSPDGLVAHWKFDETSGSLANDSSANGFVGSLQGGAAWNSEGVFGGCLALTTTSQRVVVTNGPLLELGKTNADFTVALWINLHETAAGSWRTILMKQNTAGVSRTPSLFFRYDTDQVMFRVGTTGDWNQGGQSVSSIPLNAWTHVAMLKAGLNLSLYFNGVLDKSVVLPSGTVHNSNSLYMGDDPSFIAPKADLDDVRVYARALQQNELEALLEEAPLDTDWDGVSDIEEDLDGDGVVDSGESSSTSGTDPGLRVRITRPQSVLP